MSRHLYELTKDVQGLQDLVDSGQLTADAIADTLDGLQLETKDKANKILHIVKNIDGMNNAIDEEIKRLQERKRIAENQKESIKEYLSLNMAAQGISKIECDLFTITLKKAATTVMIVDEDKLPDDLVSVTLTTKPDKKAIKARLQAGEVVEGAMLAEGKRALIIK